MAGPGIGMGFRRIALAQGLLDTRAELHAAERFEDRDRQGRRAAAWREEARAEPQSRATPPFRRPDTF